MKNALTAPALLARQRALALNSLWYFANVGCSLTLDEDTHGDIVRALEVGDFDELLLLMARGHFKTYLVACYIAWRIVKDPNFAALAVTGELEKLGKELVALVKKFLTTQRIKMWFGDFEQNAASWTTLSFEVGGRDGLAVKAPSFAVVGIDALKPGPHLDLLIFEDIENQDSVNTRELIEKTREKDSLAAPMCDRPDSKRITTGTIYDHEDLYCYKVRTYGLATKWIDEDGVEREKWENNTVRDITIETSPGVHESMRIRMFFKPLYKPDGEVLFPREFTPKKIAVLKASMPSEAQWARQYLLTPINLTNATFTSDDFTYVDKPDGAALYHILGGDFASSSLNDSDDTAFALVGFNEKGVGTILETFLGKITSDRAIEMLFDYHVRIPNLLMALEQDNYVKGWRPDFERQMHQKGLYPVVEWIIAGSRKGKIERIGGLQSVFRNGGANLLPQCRPVEAQAVLFPQGKKDLLDAVANAFQNGREAVLSDRYKHLLRGDTAERPEFDAWRKGRRNSGNQPFKGRRGDSVHWKAS